MQIATQRLWLPIQKIIIIIVGYGILLNAVKLIVFFRIFAIVASANLSSYDLLRLFDSLFFFFLVCVYETLLNHKTVVSVHNFQTALCVHF